MKLSAENVERLTASQTEAQRLREALSTIKQLVCGEKNPSWSNQFVTTQTRNKISDICDIIYRSNCPGGGKNATDSHFCGLGSEPGDRKV